MATRAVVLGASMAGLAAARALSSHFDSVTLVERDGLLDGPTTESRKGVPQGNHGHGLLASGYRVLHDYFPGMMDELVAGGALPGDSTGDFLWHQFGAWKLRTDSGIRGVILGRPFLEAAVRARVRALPNVEVLTEHDAQEPIFDAEAKRVTGLRVKRRASGETRVLDADLVIDASGRGSVAPKWLSSWGLPTVRESQLKCNIGYATAVFERREGELHGANGAIIVGAPPIAKRGGAVFGVEGSRWIVTLLGALGDHPPTELEGFREFARSLPTPDVFDLVSTREPLMPLKAHKFPWNQRRHYEELSSFPEGFLVMGDAMCSFNPVYGQGMSVALCEARSLDDCLAEGRAGLAARYFPRAAKIIEIPWSIATGEDMRFPEVEGPRPPGFALISRYMARAHRAASKDPVVLKRFFEVANLLRSPTAMLDPSIAFRVLLGGRGTAQATPAEKA